MRAREMFAIHGVQELYGHERSIAGRRLVEENDRLQVVAHRHSAAVEINDLRHWAVRVGFELKPNSRSAQVVATERSGDFNPTAIPDRFVWCMRIAFYDFPILIIKIYRFSVREVPYVVSPFRRRQLVQRCELRDRFLSRARKLVRGFGGLRACRGSDENERDSEKRERNPEFSCRKFSD
jgi:hypothetical protein